MNDKKFIVTKDEDTANRLLAHHFKLIATTAGIYTFVNDTSGNFNFNTFDVKKLHFTNNLHL